MNRCHRIPIVLLVALLAVCPIATAWSQQSDAPIADIPEPEEPDPERRGLDDPAIAAILETDPGRPADCARAAKILADLGRPDLGKTFLKRIIDAKPNQQQLAELVEEFGSPMFANMASNREMLPEARLLADAVLDAANRQLRDPRRLAALIQQLQAPSSNVRYAALAELKKGRSAAVGAMFGVLTDPARADEHPRIRAALVEMRSEAVLPLLGLLESTDPDLSVQAIRVLAGMNVKETAIYLLGPYASKTADPAVRAAAAAAVKRLAGSLPTRPQAIRVLTGRAKNYFDQSQPIATDLDGLVEISVWDEVNRRCIAKTCSAEGAALVIAARLARDAYALDNKDPEIRRLYLATLLETAAHENGLDKPLPDGEGTALFETAQFGVAVVEDLLQYALAGDHAVAATAAVQILGRRGTAEELLRGDAKLSPLMQAARHPDRRLRLAALEAVVRLQAVRPFPGSGYVAESLAYFAASSGVGRALVASPRAESLQQIVATLSAMGLRVDTAVSGRELLRLAFASPDYELVIVDTTIDRPRIDFLLQRLRHDYRTARLRVGLVARSGLFEAADRLAQRDPMTLAFSRPHSEAAIRWQIGQLSRLSRLKFVAHAERQRQAARAMGLLASVSRLKTGPYDLRRVQDAVIGTLYTPGLSTDAVSVLQNLGTPQSQRALVDLASRWTQPLEIRRAALTAFRVNLQTNGILLTTAEIDRQYDLYNQSEGLDAATQKILGLILDCIEVPSRIAKGGREDGKENGEDRERQ